ncbi:MAG: acyl-CoA dehydrogenase family protein [Candidatus Manganitrophaceae bacterium]
MIDFDLTEEQKLLQETIREFAAAEIAPGAAERDETMRFPHELIPKMAALKLFGIAIPETYGGAGLGAIETAIILEEIARVDGATALIVASHNALCTTHLYRFGDEVQRQRYVIPLAKGEKLGAWALTEPGSGSDSAAMETTAILQGDHWILNGSKLFITQGSTAGVYVIMAATDPRQETRGISAFVVDQDTPGLSLGKSEKKLGMRASDTVAIYFDNLKIPKENLIGTRHHGFQDALEILNGGRIGIGALAVGLARAALEDSIRYAKERRQFGRPIGDFQAIQWKLSEMATEIDAARLLIYRAALLKDAGEEYKQAASEAKLFASEIAMRATNQAIQIHGGSGYMKDTAVERYFRDAKLCEIGEGTSEIQRKIIAKTLLQ